MKNNLMPYLEYKGSNVLFLGKIPVHWNISSLWSVSYHRKEKNTGNLPLLSVFLNQGVIRYEDGGGQVHPPSLDLSNYQIVKPGDFVLNNQQAWRGSVGVSQHHGIISPAYIVLQLSEKILDKYANYLFRSPGLVNQFVTASKGVGDIQRQIYWSYLKHVQVPLPPLEEQTVIVRYLDYMDRRIKRFIRAKQKLIKLLNEQKQAIIHQAVTRGLDPNVPLKPSGVDWLGDIPANWEVRRIKQVANILRGKFAHRPRNDPSLYDGNYPFIQTGDVSRAIKKITIYKQTLNDKGLAVSKIFPSGTLLMTIAANIGDVAVLDFKACFPDSIVGFIPKDIVLRDFLFYVFRIMKREFLREAPVNTQGNLNVERIGILKIPIPPINEQIGIIDTLEKQLLSLNQVIEKTNNEVSFLKEYQTRLIADVVTGKLDVRQAAAALPDELEEETLDETDMWDVGARHASPLHDELSQTPEMEEEE